MNSVSLSVYCIPETADLLGFSFTALVSLAFNTEWCEEKKNIQKEAVLHLLGEKMRRFKHGEQRSVCDYKLL